MTSYSRHLSDSDATEMLGADLAACLLDVGLANPASLWQVHLCGALGAGKTTLARGLLNAMGYRGSVKSPTYTLIESYELFPVETKPSVSVYHLDLYRLQDSEELELIGYRDLMAERRALCLLEWPERGEGYVGAPDLVVELKPCAEARSASLHAVSRRASLLLQTLSEMK